MGYKVVWKTSGKRVPHYMDRVFPTKEAAKAALSNKVGSSRMGIRKTTAKKSSGHYNKRH